MRKAPAAAEPVTALTWRENFAWRLSRGGDELTANHSLAGRRGLGSGAGSVSCAPASDAGRRAPDGMNKHV